MPGSVAYLAMEALQRNAMVMVTLTSAKDLDISNARHYTPALGGSFLPARETV